MREVRYRPDGRSDAWRAAVTGTSLAVLPAEVTPHAVEAVWRRLDGGGIGAVLESLTGAFGTSLTAIPPFGLAVAEGDGIRIAVRGAVELIVETPAGAEAVSGAGVSTWTERFFAGATRLTIEVGTADDAAALPIASGVVPVASLVLTLDDSRGVPSTPIRTVTAAAAPAPVVVEPEPAPAPAESPATATPEPVEPAVEPAEPGPADADASEISAPEIAEPAAPQSADDEPAADADSADEREPGASSSEVEPSPEEPPAEEPSAGEPAAEEPPSPSGLVTGIPFATGPAPAAETPSTVTELSSPPSADTVGADDALGATIASPRKAAAPPIPPVPSLPPFVPPTHPTPSELGDHDGATISVAEARALRGAGAPSYDSTENVPGREPSQGRIRLADGRAFELERTVIIGRRPRSTRPAEAELPTLIAVDGPQHDISRNHVEIRAEGEHVLAIDLASTNGTVLMRGGHDAVRLHPQEPTMVVNGDILDLGDGVTVTFEDLP
ncbi:MULTISPECIES: FHA domain-containing protein [unclassified Microbacterium]|uniref:FHA domain-containing protein n=1 Tax=unclassified Microbacterium TaxID=2609290 RepID=UPI003866F6A9